MAAHNAIWLLVGAVLGLVGYGVPGAILGGIGGFLIGRVQDLDRQFEDLKKGFDAMASDLMGRISDLESRARGTPGSKQSVTPQASPEPTPAAEPARTHVEAEPLSASSPTTAAVAATGGPGTQSPSGSAPEPELAPYDPWATAPRRNSGGGSGIGKRVIAWFTQGNPLVRLGIVILFFGVSFLVKYATISTKAKVSGSS
jgi:uncharacterized membrane protein